MQQLERTLAEFHEMLAANVPPKLPSQEEH